MPGKVATEKKSATAVLCSSTKQLIGTGSGGFKNAKTQSDQNQNQNHSNLKMAQHWEI